MWWPPLCAVPLSATSFLSDFQNLTFREWKPPRRIPLNALCFQDVTVTSRQYSFGTVSLFPNEKQFGMFQGEEKAKQTTYNPLSVLNNERREKLTL